MSLQYDANNNIIQTIAATSVGFNEGPGTVVSPVTNAAVNGFGDPQGAPNAFTSTGGPTSKVISQNITNGSGQSCAFILNPA